MAALYMRTIISLVPFFPPVAQPPYFHDRKNIIPSKVKCFCMVVPHCPDPDARIKEKAKPENALRHPAIESHSCLDSAPCGHWQAATDMLRIHKHRLKKVFLFSQYVVL
jgi:hypothetical protein